MKNRNKYMYERRNPGKLYEDYLQEKESTKLVLTLSSYTRNKKQWELNNPNKEYNNYLKCIGSYDCNLEVISQYNQRDTERNIDRKLKEENMRQCSICKEIKSFQLFMPQDHKRRYMCRSCFNLKKNSRPGLKNQQFRKRLKNTYKISEEEYFSILENQKNKCAICDKDISEKRHLDHCHITGEVRGLLCPKCNWGLGKFKDDKTLIEKAIKYLEKQND